MNNIDFEKELNLLIEQKKIESLLKLIDHYLKKDVRSNNLSLLCTKSCILMKLGKHTEAKTTLDQAYKIDNSNVDVNSILAAYYSSRNDINAAIECYDRILINDPKCFIYIHLKFRLYIRQKKWFEAFDCLNKLEKYHQLNPYTYEDFAYYCIARKNYDDAAFYYQHVLLMKPTSSAALEFMVQYNYEKKQYDEAYEFLKCYPPETSFEKDFIHKWGKKIELKLDLIKRQKLSL
jgi:tetratricopeptide (TPR) repeat protein